MKGVLLVNLGSPDSTSTKDVKKYLTEFLMDKMVMNMSYLFRLILVKGIILRTRPEKSANAYKKIWWKEGSPLIILSERLQKKVQQLVTVPVSLGMRYGSMSIQKGLEELKSKGVDEVFVMPLYPHFAMSSYETVVEKAKSIQKANFPNMDLNFLPVFYNNPDYITVMVNNIKDQLKDFDYDHILFSYHGLPESHIRKADESKGHGKFVITEDCCSDPMDTCYRFQVFETTRLIVKKLQLKEGTYSNAFQSRLVNEPWLQPYTDTEIERFAKQGKKKLAVITPAFVTDCLETLEEIAMEGKGQFLDNGGESYKFVPCLNDNDDWASVVAKWIKNN